MENNNKKDKSEIIKNENNDKKNNEKELNKNDQSKESPDEMANIFSPLSSNYENVDKDIPKVDKDVLSRKSTNNETVLEQKVNKKIKKQGTISRVSSFLQPEEISILEKSLNIAIVDNNNINKKENEYLSLRDISSYNINEYEDIRKMVSKNLYYITTFLFEKPGTFNIYHKSKAVGPLLPLTTLIESAYGYKPEYQTIMQQKYERMKNYICNYRTIYGDGNCYYRAVMFRYIELLILNKKAEFLKLLIIDIYKSFKNEEITKRLFYGKQAIDPNIISQIMIIILELVENNEIIKAHHIFYKALLYSKYFDLSLILYFRFILYDYIKKNEKKLYLENFPVLIGNLLPSNYEKDGIFDFNSFYIDYLLKQYVPAEKIIIYLTPFVLGINLDIILFDDNEDEILKHFKFVGEDILKIKQTIYVIHKMGHYENVFDFKDNKEFNDIYCFYRNDMPKHFINLDPKLIDIYSKIKNCKKVENTANQNNNQNQLNNDLSNQKNEINNNTTNDQKKKNDDSFQESVNTNNNISNNKNNKKTNDNLDNHPNKENNNALNEHNQNKRNNKDNNVDDCVHNQNEKYLIDNKINDHTHNKKKINNIDNNKIIKDKGINKNNCLYNIDNNVEYNEIVENIDLLNNKIPKIKVTKLTSDDKLKKNEFALDNNTQNLSNFQTTLNNNIYVKNVMQDMDYKYDIKIENQNNQGINNYINNKCMRCGSSIFNEQNRSLKNICKKCIKFEIINQSKQYYVNYLVSMFPNINRATIDDFNNYFINKIIINVFGHNFNIYQIIEEYIFNSNIQSNKILKNLVEYLKNHICLYCYKDINIENFKIPCGCNFCSRDDLENFFKYIVSFQLTYKFKCSCAYEYKPKQVLELCVFLYSNKIYGNNQNLINHLESIFKPICCKCGCIGNNQNKLYQISVSENFPFNYIHSICTFCINLNDTTKIADCIICNKKHQYIPLII